MKEQEKEKMGEKEKMPLAKCFAQAFLKLDTWCESMQVLRMNESARRGAI